MLGGHPHVLCSGSKPDKRSSHGGKGVRYTYTTIRTDDCPVMAHVNREPSDPRYPTCADRKFAECTQVGESLPAIQPIIHQTQVEPFNSAHAGENIEVEERIVAFV